MPPEEQSLGVQDISGIMDQGEFQWGIVSPTGIALKDETPEKEWHRITGEVCRIFEFTGKKHAQAAMMLGDLLRFGEDKFSETYADAIDATRDYMRVAIQTLKNWQWIAGRITPSRRRENLSLAHHEAVARLEIEDQDKFLDLAESDGMNVRELRSAIREARPSKRKTKTKVKITHNETAETVSDMLSRCAVWLTIELVTPAMKKDLESLHKLFRRKWQSGHKKK